MIQMECFQTHTKMHLCINDTLTPQLLTHYMNSQLLLKHSPSSGLHDCTSFFVGGGFDRSDDNILIKIVLPCNCLTCCVKLRVTFCVTVLAFVD